MSKLNLKAINWKKVVGVGSAAVAAIFAFTEAIADQKQEEKIEDLEQRIDQLENK
jgi:hypothetical protein